MNREPKCAIVACVLAAGLLTGLGSPAFAQLGNEFRLDLSLVARRGNPATSIEDVSGPVVIQDTERIRIELRYRITDLVANNAASRGLAFAVMQIQNNRGSVAGTVERSFLTNSQLSPGAHAPIIQGALDPDTSGQDDFDNTGMAEPFRGGLETNTGVANGYYDHPTLGTQPGVTLGGSGFHIVPVALAASGQNSWIGSAATNIGPSNTDTNPATWALYSFDYIPASGFLGSITFTASIEPQAGSGDTFGFFTRVGTVNNPTPISAPQYTPGSVTINVVPAPASGLAMLAGAALLVRRRR